MQTAIDAGADISLLPPVDKASSQNALNWETANGAFKDSEQKQATCRFWKLLVGASHLSISTMATIQFESGFFVLPQPKSFSVQSLCIVGVRGDLNMFQLSSRCAIQALALDEQLILQQIIRKAQLEAQCSLSMLSLDVTGKH